MAQGSAFWEGRTVGDAAGSIWASRYTAVEYSDVYSKWLQSNSVRGFVLGGYANNLAVSANSPAAMNVLVATGAAMIRGRIYENDASQTLTIGTADATNPRLDRIVIRINFTAQTIILTVLAGTAAASPSLPSLTQSATTYEISLGYVYVAALAATIAATDVHDEREFYANAETLLTSLAQDNMLANSEFMAFSNLDVSSRAVGVFAPDLWALVLTPTGLANATKPAQMVRGRAVQITSNAASEGISQTVPVKASTTYVLRTLINVTAGDVGSIVVTTNAASPGTITKYTRRTGAWITEQIIYTTESDATTMTISLLCLNSTDVVSFGQSLLLEGYLTGPYRAIHEIIPFAFSIGDSAWTDDTVGTAIIPIDFDTEFQTLILPGTKAVQVLAAIKDSNASGGTTAPSIFISHSDAATLLTGINIRASGGINNQYYYGQGWIPIKLTGNTIRVQTVENGIITVSIAITGITI